MNDPNMMKLRELSLMYATQTLSQCGATPDEIVACAEKYFLFISASPLAERLPDCSAELQPAP